MVNMRCKKQVYLKGVNFMKKLQRKILSTGISVTLLLGIISIPAVAEETTTDTQSSIVTNTITNSSIEKIEFEKDEEYSTNSSGGDRYYYNTGQSCPAQAVYGDGYDLLNTLQRGDIIYEDAGGADVTGHIAIVEGKFYDYDTQKFHIRIIEPILSGVKRGIIDDVRMVEKEATFLRLKNGLTTSQVMRILTFCRNQLGKEWSIDHYNRQTSVDSGQWYCSEMVWAAYYSQGINIDVNQKTTGPITPKNIYDSPKLKKIVVY